jgi:hypothetical protein
MKTYAIEVTYYIQAEDESDLDETLYDIGIKDSEYYGGYYIKDVEEMEVDEEE